jgi:hypothetical protein
VQSATLSIVAGGEARGVYLEGSALLQMSGGLIEGSAVAFDDSVVQLSGGRVHRVLRSDDCAEVLLDGAEVSEDLKPRGTSNVLLSGGELGGDLMASESSGVTVTGGMLGEPGDLFAADSSAVTIVGTGFAVDNVAVLYDEQSNSYQELPQSGRLTGTLMEGDEIGTDFFQGGFVNGSGQAFAGTITLVRTDDYTGPVPVQCVPEPGVVLLKLAGVLSLAALRRSRRSTPGLPRVS